MEEKTGKRFGLDMSPAGNSYGLTLPGIEFEVYDAFFSPEERKEGVLFSTGRSADEIADKKTTRQWFQEFADRIKAEGYSPLRD